MIYIYILCTATPLTDENTNRYLTFRTYRAEKTYAVSSGKWLVNIINNYIIFYNLPIQILRYFEFEILTNGPMRVGWARFNCSPGYQIGSDENSWSFDGYNVCIQKMYKKYFKTT